MPVSAANVWSSLQSEFQIEKGFGQEHTPIKEKQVKWLADKASCFPHGDALDLGFGCGFSAISMSLGGNMHVEAVTIERPGNSRLDRAIARTNILCPGGVTFLCGRRSDQYMPSAISQGRMFDIMFVDAGHLFDDVFIDVHFSKSIVRPGGLLILDDTHFAPIRTVANWLNTNMNHFWEPFEITENTVSWRRTDRDAFDETGVPHRDGRQEQNPFSVETENNAKYQTQPNLDPPLNGNFTTV